MLRHRPISLRVDHSQYDAAWARAFHRQVLGGGSWRRRELRLLLCLPTLQQWADTRAWTVLAVLLKAGASSDRLHIHSTGKLHKSMVQG